MSHMFSKKSKIKPYDASDVPLPPKVDEIIEDLESTKPDDIVFTTDIGLVDVDEVKQDIYETNISLPRRFQQKEIVKSNNPDKLEKDIGAENLSERNQEQDDLYEKVIEYNQNVEKLGTLGAKLTKKLQDLAETKEDLAEVACMW